MSDPGAEHGETFAHERGEARPALGRDEIAVDMGAGRGDVDIDAADGGDLRLAILQRRDAPAASERPSTAISTCTPWQIVKIGLPDS